MKKICIIILISLFSVACGPTEADIQKALEETHAAWTETPTATATSTLTSTPYPTPTETLIPTITCTNTKTPTNTSEGPDDETIQDTRDEIQNILVNYFSGVKHVVSVDFVDWTDDGINVGLITDLDDAELLKSFTYSLLKESSGIFVNTSHELWDLLTVDKSFTLIFAVVLQDKSNFYFSYNSYEILEDLYYDRISLFEWSILALGELWE